MNVKKKGNGHINLIVIIVVLLIFCVISYFILSNGTYKSCYLKNATKTTTELFFTREECKEYCSTLEGKWKYETKSRTTNNFSHFYECICYTCKATGV